MDVDQQSLGEKIKYFLASNPQFTNPKFDPAPFLIQILKEKQSEQQAIEKRRQQLIEIQNQAFDLIDQICSQYPDDFFQLLEVPQKQGEQLQKLRSNISLVKKKTKQTKSLLANTQKDIHQLYFNCIFNKTVYKKIKQLELKINQYRSASLALKNNQFLNSSINIPSFQGNSILQSALAIKAENLRLELLSRGIQQISLFIYSTPKIVLPASQILIERVSSEQSIYGNLKTHDSFHKRYSLFKKAFCLQYLPTLWDFKQLQTKKGKIHLIFDIIKGALNIGKIQEILQSLEIDCKKSINSIFLLIRFYFSLEIQEQKKVSLQKKYISTKEQSMRWFLCQKGHSHISFISVVLDVMGVMMRKVIIFLLIIKEFQISSNQLSNLQSYNFFELILKQLNQIVENIYINQQADNLDYINQQIYKKIKSPKNYIHWANVRNIIIKSLIIIDQNLAIVDSQHRLTKKDTIKPRWKDIISVDQCDKKFNQNFHIDFMKLLEEIFNKQAKSFGFQSLQQISNSKQIDQSELSFCKYFSSQEMKYSREYIFTISLFSQIQRFFINSNFEESRLRKYQIYLLSVLYLKYFITSKTLEKTYSLRKINNKLKTIEKDFKKSFDKICPNKKFEVSIKPWKKSATDQSEQSKYRLIQNLKGIQKQNEMLLTYCLKNFKNIEKYKDSQNLMSHLSVYDRLQPANYDENFNSKLVRVWDQLPEIETSIFQLGICLFHKIMELHMIVVSVIYLESLKD